MAVTGQIDKVSPELLRAVTALSNSLGRDITSRSGFRSREEQQQLYDLYKAGKGNLAAVPGTSEHEFGSAMDLDIEDVPDSMLNKFGLYRTAEGEPWHVSNIPREARGGGKQMAPATMTDQFSGKQYQIPLNPDYPTVVPENFYKKLNESPIVNSKALQQRAMVDMLPILAEMYKGATYNDAAGGAAKVIADMITGQAAARGAEGDIQNLQTQRGNMTDIIGMMSKSRNPSELAGLLAGAQTYGGQKLDPALIGATSITPSQIASITSGLAAHEMAQSQAKYNTDMHLQGLREQMAANERLANMKMALERAASETAAQQRFADQKQNAADKYRQVMLDIEKYGIDPQSQSRLYSESLPAITEYLKYFPQAATQIGTSYKNRFGNAEGLNKLMEQNQIPIRFDENGVPTSVKNSSIPSAKSESKAKPDNKQTSQANQKVDPAAIAQIIAEMGMWR